MSDRERATTARRGAWGWRGAAVVLTMLALLAGCGAEPEPAGTLVGTWRQPDADYDLLFAAGTDHGLVTEAAALTALADGIDAAAAAVREDDDSSAAASVTEELRATDLTEVVLVVAVYPRCTEYSQVLVEQGDPTTVTVEIRTDEENVACAWSPLTLDVWAVPRSLVGDDVVRVSEA